MSFGTISGSYINSFPLFILIAGRQSGIVWRFHGNYAFGAEL